MQRQSDTIRRQQLKGLLDFVTDRRPDGRPLFPIFSVFVERRQPLFLRYNPVDQYTNGPYVRDGDHCNLADRGQNGIRDDRGRWYEFSNDTNAPIFRRRGKKIIIEDAGVGRWMVVKNYDETARNDTKHHQFKPDGRLNYDPAAHDLYLVRGMYSDLPTNGRIGRYGQWRPWAQICLRSCSKVRCSDRNGTPMEWAVAD